MELSCKFCSARFKAAITAPLPHAVRVICPSCRREMVLRPTSPGTERLPDSLLAPPAAQNAGSVSMSGGPGIRYAAIADEPRPFRDFLASELENIGFRTTLFESGIEALGFVREKRADLVILNVYLKGKLGVEISEEIKADPALSSTKVVLIGALFRANRFRANPTNLYGADEYIEEQIPAKELQQIVRKLFPGVTKPSGGAEPKEFDEARRLARLILSDIVIYNVEKVNLGIREGTFFEILAPAIKEGRDYYEGRVPPSVRAATDFFTQTLEQFVEMKHEELGKAGRGAEKT